MKTAFVLLVSFAAISCAQDRKPSETTPQKDKKRLESVTWDLQNHKLIWVVQKGTEHGGEFVASSSDKYEISPDDAVMAFAHERRGFTKEEATSLHRLLDTLSLYCAESVVWWDQGQGDKLDGTTPSKPKNGEPDIKDKDKGDGQKQRVGEPHKPTPTDLKQLVALLAPAR